LSTVTAAGDVVGVGDGLGLGLGDALATGVVAEVDEALPPHPLTVSRRATKSTEKSKMQLRTHTPKVRPQNLGRTLIAVELRGITAETLITGYVRVAQKMSFLTTRTRTGISM
jgi:hypothetical protein